MTKQIDNMKNKMTKTEKKENPKTFDDYLKQMAPAMKQALPKHMDIERMTRLATTVFRTTPGLREAEMGSVLGAVMQAAQLGLEPGPLGHCYLLPYKNRNK